MAHTPSSPVCLLPEIQHSSKYSSELTNLNQSPTMSTEETLHDLITANHILHYHNVLDAYGHISVRNPTNPSRFFLSYSLAPALISSTTDLIEYHISDASPVNSTAKGYSERFIHSEILKQYPSINSVVHSHSEAVLPYTVSGVPLQAAFHMAGFLGLHLQSIASTQLTKSEALMSLYSIPPPIRNVTLAMTSWSRPYCAAPLSPTPSQSKIATQRASAMLQPLSSLLLPKPPSPPMNLHTLTTPSF